ncbi:MAG: hypothetical protein M3033_11690 [Acidobacteriota bacterium]|nr:hypothetical protein [Acidobacteriota bacterium]
MPRQKSDAGKSEIKRVTLVLNNITEKQPKSIFLGRVSLIAGLCNILLLVLGPILSQYSGHILTTIIFLAFALSLSIGLGSGIAAFIIKRVWVGLALNILMLIFLGVCMFIYTLFCCAPPPPQLR